MRFWDRLQNPDKPEPRRRTVLNKQPHLGAINVHPLFGTLEDDPTESQLMPEAVLDVLHPIDTSVGSASREDLIKGNEGEEVPAHTHVEVDITDLLHNAVRLQGYPIAADVLGGGQDGYVLTWDGGVLQWSAVDPAHDHDSDYYTEAEVDALLHAEAHNIASHSDTTATGAELDTLTDGSDAADIHTHDARYYTEGEVDALLHAEAHTIASHSDTSATGAELNTLTDTSDADGLHSHDTLAVDADVLKKDGSVGLTSDWAAGAHKITGLTQVETDEIENAGDLMIDAKDVGANTTVTIENSLGGMGFSTTLHVDGLITLTGTVDGVDIAARDHAEAHTVASHSDTTGTGAELDTLTDGSDADALHIHGSLATHIADATDPHTAAMSVSTSVTTPLVIGGTANDATLILQGSSHGTPAGDSIEFKVTGLTVMKITGDPTPGVSTHQLVFGEQKPQNAPYDELIVCTEESYCGLASYVCADANRFPVFRCGRARGDLDASAAVQNGDVIGALSFLPYASTNAYLSRAMIYCIVDGAPSGTMIPTSLRFYTGTTGTVESFRVQSDQNILVASDNELHFRDSGQRIYSDAANDLLIEAAADIVLDAADDITIDAADDLILKAGGFINFHALGNLEAHITSNYLRFETPGDNPGINWGTSGMGKLIIGTSATTCLTWDKITDPAIGFLGAAAVVRQVVAGARDEPEGAYKSMLAALVALGLVTDNTTAS